MSEMLILAVDTSGPEGSLCLARVGAGNVKSAHSTRWHKRAQHSETITVQLSQVLQSARVDLTELSHLAVNVGPGSFTGLRVGINMTRSLAYSLSLPTVTVTSLELLANTYLVSGETGVFGIRAVRDFLYVGVYAKSGGAIQTVVSPRSMRESELSSQCSLPSSVFGASGQRVFVEGKNADFLTQTKAEGLVQLLANTPHQPTFWAWPNVTPLYIRGSEAEEKLRGCI